MSAFDDLVMEVKLLKHVIAERHAESEALCRAIEAYLDTEGYNIRQDGNQWIAEWVQPETGDAHEVGRYDTKADACIAGMFDAVPLSNDDEQPGIPF